MLECAIHKASYSEICCRFFLVRAGGGGGGAKRRENLKRSFFVFCAKRSRSYFFCFLISVALPPCSSIPSCPQPGQKGPRPFSHEFGTKCRFLFFEGEKKNTSRGGGRGRGWWWGNKRQKKKKEDEEETCLSLFLLLYFFAGVRAERRIVEDGVLTGAFLAEVGV